MGGRLDEVFICLGERRVPFGLAAILPQEPTLFGDVLPKRLVAQPPVPPERLPGEPARHACSEKIEEHAYVPEKGMAIPPPAGSGTEILGLGVAAGCNVASWIIETSGPTAGATVWETGLAEGVSAIIWDVIGARGGASIP